MYILLCDLIHRALLICHTFSFLVLVTCLYNYNNLTAQRTTVSDLNSTLLLLEDTAALAVNLSQEDVVTCFSPLFLGGQSIPLEVDKRLIGCLQICLLVTNLVNCQLEKCPYVVAHTSFSSWKNRVVNNSHTHITVQYAYLRTEIWKSSIFMHC